MSYSMITIYSVNTLPFQEGEFLEEERLFLNEYYSRFSFIMREYLASTPMRVQTWQPNEDRWN